MPAGPQQTRQIGTACRIYKNADDKVIAIDKVAVVERMRVNKQFKKLRSAFKTFKRTLFHFGGNRVISTILSVGDYNSLSVDQNDAVWSGTEESNDIEITFNDLPQIGDSV